MTRRTFILKPLALIRFLWEIFAVVLLLFLPLAVWKLPQLQHIPELLKIVGYILGGIALVLLPQYGWAAIGVVADDEGIGTFALFRRRYCLWPDIQKLRQRTDWGWRRFVLECVQGDLIFPAMLAGQEDLLKLIREHLPQSNEAQSGPKTFKQDLSATIWQYVRLLLEFVFVILIWWFFATTGLSKSTAVADVALILIICAAATVISLWRAWVVVTMPRYVEIEDAAIIVRTIFGEQRIAWSDILKLSPPLPFLPAGLMLKADKNSFLLSDSLDVGGELKALVEAGFKQKG